MRHSVAGRKLSRTKDERRRLIAGLVRDLLTRNSITTTLAKAKTVAPVVEKLITKAKEGSENNRRRVLAVLSDKKIVHKLFDDAKTRFAARTSGFTRIIKLGSRRGDASNMAMLTFVDEAVAIEIIKPKKEAPVKKEKPIKSPKKVKKS